MAKNKNPKRSEMFQDDVSQEFLKKIDSGSLAGRFDEVYAIAKKYLKMYPESILIAYYEAVYTAEGTTGLTKAQINAKYKSAAKKLKKLFPRLRNVHPHFRASVRNEYYWFSKQPRKQYNLGKEMVAKGIKKAYYSQGVGAAELAKEYALKGNRKQCLLWAKRSEKAWLQYFKISPKWPNSHMFYGSALAFQGRLEEAERAFSNSTKFAGNTKEWKLEIKEYRKYLVPSLKKMELEFLK